MFLRVLNRHFCRYFIQVNGSVKTLLLLGDVTNVAVVTVADTVLHVTVPCRSTTVECYTVARILTLMLGGNYASVNCNSFIAYRFAKHLPLFHCEQSRRHLGDSGQTHSIISARILPATVVFVSSFAVARIGKITLTADETQPRRTDCCCDIFLLNCCSFC